MRQLKKLMGVILLLSFCDMFALTISGVGYATLEVDAKKEALSDLVHNISVDVKSDFQTITKSFDKSFDRSSQKFVELSSNLPILGVKYQKLVGEKLVKSTATISKESSLKVYMNELHRLQKDISQSLLELESQKNSDIKYVTLKNIMKNIENFNKHKVVAIVLGAQKLPELTITKGAIVAKLKQYTQNIETLRIASDVLSSGITQRNVYITPLKPSGSSEVTQFAKLMKNEMRKNIKSVKYSSDAEYFLKGEYEILKEALFITVNLYDMNNRIVHTNTAFLKPSSYAHTNYRPLTKTFDEAKNSEFVKSGKLSVNIGFKGYNRADGIDLNENDVVDIVIKANKPICYFLLGHTLHENQKFSYVLPIGSDNTPFINKITGEDVNVNITIAQEVPILEPFGSENLQIFANTLKSDGSCSLVVPQTFQNEQGYYVVQGQPTNVVRKTRALNFTKKKSKIEKSEASVSWTSFKK